MLDAWKDLTSSLPAALETASAEAMGAHASQPSPSFDGTIGGMVSFLAMHETYHVGQLELLRHLAGKNDKII